MLAEHESHLVSLKSTYTM